MYVPASFAESDLTRLHEFVEAHSFATLVSHDGAEPFATQLPFLLDRTIGPHGRLVGHLARANPQWKHAAGQRVKVLFQGPHAYVSPAWYEAVNVVPTWNYVAVHAAGTFRVIDEPARVLDIVRRTVEQYESPRPAPWSLDSAEPEFIEKLLVAIVGFEIAVDRLEGKWKLSQNHSIERREKVIAALANETHYDSQAISELMVKTLPPRT